MVTCLVWNTNIKSEKKESKRFEKEQSQRNPLWLESLKKYSNRQIYKKKKENKSIRNK